MLFLSKYSELGAPLTLAALTFSLFAFLEKVASKEARHYLNNWINSRHNPISSSRSFIIYIFDTIYKTPINHKSIIRIIFISVLCTFFSVFHFYYMTFYFILCEECSVRNPFIIQIFSNIIADFVSIYTIRKLIISNYSIKMKFIFTPIIALFLILSVYTIFDVARFAIETNSFHPNYFFQGFKWWIDLIFSKNISSRKSIFFGALIIYIWIPALLWIIIFIYLMNKFKNGASFVQWLVKNGNKKPFLMVGYMGSISIFFASVLVLLIFKYFL